MSDTEKLICLIEKKECIWKTNSDGYLNKHFKKKAWEEIAGEINLKFKNMSLKEKQVVVTDIKKKWSNIRDYYKKDKEPNKSGAAGGKKRKYIYADMLSFLDEVIERRQTEGNFEKENDENIEENNTPRKLPPKSSRINAVQSEILQIFRDRRGNANKSESAEAQFLLSFVPEVEQMTPLQKIEFKAGMVDLLKKIKYSTNVNEQPQQSSYTQCNPFNEFPQIVYTNHPQSSNFIIKTTPLPKNSPHSPDSPHSFSSISHPE